jgi:four helix bundle protein
MDHPHQVGELRVWQAAMTLVEQVYRVTAKFPADERFGLVAQLRRAGVSIPSNIAEGRRRKREKAFLYHLDVALGSQAEVEVQLEIAHRLGFISDDAHAPVHQNVVDVGKMLNGLIASMQNDES